MLSLIGFLTVLTIIILLITGRLSPLIPLVLIPVISALVAGFSINEIGEYFESGLNSVIGIVVMFIFAILFFGIMQDAGLFDPLIQFMIRISNGNIVAICIASVIIAVIAQLDGSGASTFLITIPALLPLYKKLHMSPYLLLLIVGGSAAVMNMLPWSGPLGRAATVLGMDVTELWRPLIPVQLVGVLLMVVIAVILGFRERKRIFMKYGNLEGGVASEENDFVEKKRGLPKLIWINLFLTILVVLALVWGRMPAGLVFMIAVCISLPVNYPRLNQQSKSLKKHAHNAMTMGMIILAAGSFLGILTGTGMLNAMAISMTSIIPESVGFFFMS